MREIPNFAFFIQKIMSFTNFQKTIALTSGVLVLSVAIALVVLAWTGPTANPPAGNADAPINVGSDAQTKSGDLTVSTLTTSGGKLYLNNSGFEGDIERVDEIIGYNDLQLRSDPTSKTEIFLDDGNQGIKLKHQGTDVLVIGDDDAVHLPDLTTAPDFTGCFLELDENGKVRCYTGGGIPGGNVLNTQEILIKEVLSPEESSAIVCDSYTMSDADADKKVIKVRAKHVSTAGGAAKGEFWFYINDIEVFYHSIPYTWGTIWSPARYHRVLGGDVLKICIKSVYWPMSYAYMYTLDAKKADITHAFADEAKILYRHDADGRGEMKPGGAHYVGGSPAPSVIISAEDEVDVSWIID